MSVEKRTRGEMSEDKREVDGRKAFSIAEVRVAGTSSLGIPRASSIAYVEVVVSVVVVIKSSSL